jgi:hypothetical protein
MPKLPNKIIYGNQTLLDLTGDTVSPETLAEGVTAHNSRGELIVGTMTAGGGTPFGICSTAASTKMKEVTIDGVTDLTAGLTIRVHFLYGFSTNKNIRLNVNNLGKPDDETITNIPIKNLPASVNTDECVLTLTLCIDKYDEVWSWYVNQPAETASAGSVGLGYAESGSNLQRWTKPSGWSPAEGGVLVIKHTYDLSSTGAKIVSSTDGSFSGAIKHRGSNVAANVIKSGDTCTYMLHYVGSMVYDWEMILLANDRMITA